MGDGRARQEPDRDPVSFVFERIVTRAHRELALQLPLLLARRIPHRRSSAGRRRTRAWTRRAACGSPPDEGLREGVSRLTASSRRSEPIVDRARSPPRSAGLPASDTGPAARREQCCACLPPLGQTARGQQPTELEPRAPCRAQLGRLAVASRLPGPLGRYAGECPKCTPNRATRSAHPEGPAVVHRFWAAAT